MMPIVQDFVKRWWWLLGIQFLVTFVFWALPGPMAQRIHFENLGPIALSFDLMRGLARSCLALPLARRAFARQIWIGVILVPTAVGSLAMLCASIFHGDFSMQDWALHSVIGCAISGSLLLLLTGMPTKPSTTILGQWRDGIFGALWGMGMMVSMLFLFMGSAVFPNLNAFIPWVLSAMGVGTILSYFTTQRMVVNRAIPLGTRQGSLNSRMTPDVETVAGWRLWIRLELRNQLLLGSMVFCGLLLTRMITHSQGMQTGGVLEFGQMGAFMMMGTLMMFMFGVMSLRAMRGLPISRQLLATIFVLRPMLGCLTICLFFVLCGLLFGTSSALSFGGILTLLISGALMANIQAICFRFPHPLFGICVTFFVGPFVAGYEHLQRFVTQAPILICCLIVAGYLGAWMLHFRFLRTSSKIYRRQAWLARFMPTANR